jgi:hypothetical protein
LIIHERCELLRHTSATHNNNNNNNTIEFEQQNHAIDRWAQCIQLASLTIVTDSNQMSICARGTTPWQGPFIPTQSGAQRAQPAIDQLTLFCTFCSPQQCSTMQLLAMAISVALLSISTSAARLAQYVRIFDLQTTDTTNYINLQQVQVYGEQTHSDAHRRTHSPSKHPPPDHTDQHPQHSASV